MSLLGHWLRVFSGLWLQVSARLGRLLSNFFNLLEFLFLLFRALYRCHGLCVFLQSRMGTLFHLGMLDWLYIGFRCDNLVIFSLWLNNWLYSDWLHHCRLQSRRFLGLLGNFLCNWLNGLINSWLFSRLHNRLWFFLLLKQHRSEIRFHLSRNLRDFFRGQRLLIVNDLLCLPVVLSFRLVVDFGLLELLRGVFEMNHDGSLHLGLLGRCDRHRWCRLGLQGPRRCLHSCLGSLLEHLDLSRGLLGWERYLDEQRVLTEREEPLSVYCPCIKLSRSIRDLLHMLLVCLPGKVVEEGEMLDGQGRVVELLDHGHQS